MADDLTRWPLRNDQIVLMVMMGVNANDIAAQFGLSRRMVDVIYADPRASEIKKAAKTRFHEKLIETTEEQLDAAAKLSVKVLARTLKADISPLHRAKANQDRVAVKLLQGRGFLRAEDRGAGGGYQVTPEQFNKLLSCLSKADEAKNIDPFAVPTVIQEAEVEIVENEGEEEAKEDVA